MLCNANAYCYSSRCFFYVATRKKSCFNTITFYISRITLFIFPYLILNQ